MPGVVGVHVKVVGLPAARENPWGTLKGLGFAAQAAVASPPRTESSGRRILVKRMLDGSIMFDFWAQVGVDKKDEAIIYYRK